MKYTNIKKLLIKFMGGGLINFPTRFLRWIKIDGDAEGDEGGGGGDDEIQYLLQIKTLIEQVPGFTFDETEENPTYVIPIADFDESTISSGDNIMGDKNTADYVIRLEIEDPNDAHIDVYIYYITSDELGYLKQIMNGGGSDSIDELINAAKNLVIKITESGYNKVYPSEGSPYKNSFDYYENEDDFDNMISVPIENYLDISNMDVYKIIMNFVNSALKTDRGDEIYLKHIDYHVGQNSLGSEVKLIKPEFSEHCIIEYDEIGLGSGGGGSYCYFNLDPNDITKVMVYPEDV